MTEDLLHFIWKNQLFSKSELLTDRGENIEIIDPGRHNHNAGPDFSFARVGIDGIRWAGQVEIHIRSDDWIKHGHSADQAYENVILHVVWEGVDHSDKKLNAIPQLTLKGRVSKSVLERYSAVINRRVALPCKPLWPSLDEQQLRMWLERMLIERVEERVAWFEQELKHNRGDWEAALHRRILLGLGGRINAEAFEHLSHLLPLKDLRKYCHQRSSLEALVMGRAGFLSAPKDEYLSSLRKEYDYLVSKHRWSEGIPPLWKFGRMRPSNFPSVRLIQWIDLMMISKCRWLGKWDEELLEVDRPSYWSNHLIPARLSKMGVPRVTEQLIQNLRVNVLFPFRVARKKSNPTADLSDLLDDYFLLPPEDDIVIREFKELPLGIEHSGYTQALHQLKRAYCDQMRCTNCAIGRQFLISKL